MKDSDQMAPTDMDPVRQHHRIATEGMSDMKKTAKMPAKKPTKMPKKGK